MRNVFRMNIHKKRSYLSGIFIFHLCRDKSYQISINALKFSHIPYFHQCQDWFESAEVHHSNYFLHKTIMD